MARVGRWRKRKGMAVAAGLAAGALAAGAAAGVAFGGFPVEGVAPNGAGVLLGFADGMQAAGAWAAGHFPGVGAWERMTPVLAKYRLLDDVVLRSKTAMWVGFVGGALGYREAMKFVERERVGMRHIRGRILREDYHAIKAAQAVFAKDMKRRGNGPGLFLAPGVRMDRARETEGIFVLGAPGSGKTVWYRFLLDQIIARGEHAAGMLRQGVPLGKLEMLPDKIIAVDVKGDQTERWPNEDFLLFAPHDTGIRKGKDGVERRIGYAWDIGKDLLGAPAARDFAARVVKATDEPVWGDAARGIFTGMIRGLQQEHGTDWGWGDLYEVVSMKAKELRGYLDKWDPVAAEFVQVGKTGPTRTSASYLANITTGVVPMVEALAAAWGDYPPENRVSLNEWVLNPNPEKRTIILQRSGKVREISAAWIRAVLFQLASFATSPDLDEDDRRRVWFICDEAPQYLSKDDGFLEIIEVGRSKGYCAVVAAQVNKQFEKVWSAAEMETLESMMRTKLIFRTGGGSVADYLAEKVVGSSDWERRDESRNLGEASKGSYSNKVERELVVMPNYFDDRLGAGMFGVKVLWIGPKDVCRLQVPYPRGWKKGTRAATVTAPWVSDNKFRYRGRGAAEGGEAGANAGQRPVGGMGAIPLPPGSGAGWGQPAAPAGGAPVGGMHRPGVLGRLAAAGLIQPAAGGPAGGGGGYGAAAPIGGLRGPVGGADAAGDDDEED